MFDLGAEVDLTTGSTRGMGKAIAITVSQTRARVLIASRKADAWEPKPNELRDTSRGDFAVPCNASYWIGSNGWLRPRSRRGAAATVSSATPP